jgi:hypothetical protein
MSASDPVAESTAAPTAPARTCENCGAALLGEHCYACGQPTKGLIRQFSDILGDFFDTVLNIDARIFRTLGPLLAHPGRLSLEYFAGHRVRYVSPVRLFVFLSIATFLVAKLVAPDLKVDNAGGGLQLNVADDGNSLQHATTVAEVVKQRDFAIAQLDEAIKKGDTIPGLKVGLQASQKAIRNQAAARIAQLQSAHPPANNGVSPAPSTAPTPPGAQDEDNDFNFNGTAWDETSNPARIGWLGDTGNRWFNQLIGRAKTNSERIQHDPNAFKNAVLGAMPTALFLLLPIFAVLLKIAYVFKRRLYMEHLIVALHSHAFLCIATLILIAVSELQSWIGGSGGFLHGLTNWVAVAVWVWMPTYLLIMQKRIYGQGWIMTLMKFFSLGLIYAVLLSLGVAATMLATLVWM